MLGLFRRDRRWKPEKRPAPVDPVRQTRLKFRVLQGAIILAFLALSVQLWKLQIVLGDYYRTLADNNRLRVVPVPAPRGVIYDARGNLLVRNIPSFSVTVMPADLPRDRQAEVAGRLARILNIPAAEITQKVEERRRQDPFSPVAIKDNVDQKTAFIVEENRDSLPGVQVQVRAIRQYLEGPLMAHILGFMGRIDAEEYAELRQAGYSLNDQLGKQGIEASYERELRGQPGREEIVVDASGRKVEVLHREDPVPGNNLVLSIDLELQRVVYQALKSTMGRSDHAAAVVVNAKTGEILAMVAIPDYDNNLFSTGIGSREWEQLLEDPRRPLVNSAIGGAWAPGSTFKLVTGSAGLQEGVVTANTVIYSPGYIRIRNEVNPAVPFIFRDWAALGALNFRRALAMSSNVYFGCVAGGCPDQRIRGLGIDKLAEYAHRFGFGEKTGIDLPGEAEGTIPSNDWYRKVRGEPAYLGDVYNAGIGQGEVTVTPLQLAMATAAVANGGKLLKPQLVREVRDAEGRTVWRFEPVVRRDVGIKPEYLQLVRAGMRDGVTSGIVTVVNLPGVAVAGKTGTAEWGPLNARRYHGWFTGFAPYDDPEIVVTVFHELSQGGSYTAAPAARQIFEYYFSRKRG